MLREEGGHLSAAPPRAEPSPDVVVVGGGIIGMATAWRAATRGMRVTLVDPSPGKGATWAAAGLLAPVSELHYGEETLLGLNIESARRYPPFIAELEELTETTVGYRPIGSLMVGLDPGDRAVLTELHAFHASLGLQSCLLTRRQARTVEPMLAPGVGAALLVEGDHQVDNRLLASALARAAELAGVRFAVSPVTEVTFSGDRVAGTVLSDGTTISSRRVVLAAGCWSSRVGGLPPGLLPIRPVKGQILRLRGPADPPLLNKNLIGIVAGSHVYLGPRSTGEIVVGATVEEQGFDTTIRAGAVYELLRDAVRLVPGVSELSLVETHAGLRPGSPDNAPLLGPVGGAEGLVVASGHYRNGILLAPVTADLVADFLVSTRVPDQMLPFSPDRFRVGAGR